ncbi:MAG: alpha-hydroxy-acid oxidizing protein [Burkholderiales bacterium]|nr:alpha-hydroxy-acid oxidizing protein [Burkholderiales bacterium]
MARRGTATANKGRGKGQVGIARKAVRKTEERKYPRIDGRAAANFVSLQEIVHAARRNLSQDLWDHLSGGSDSETTLARNRMGFDRLALRQRVLVDVRHIDISTTILGQKIASPVFLAPVGGFVGFVHPEGARNVARAAVARGTAAFISTAAKPSIEAAAEAVKEPLIFQLYVRADRKWVEDILDRAKAAGYRALCVCVDRNYYGRRERDIISRASVREGFGDPSYQMALNWNDLVWMKARMKLPLIVKGVATAEDARLSVEHGADVVYVSNHGGRQLDQGQGTIEVLPEVVEAVDGRAEVLFDGGILRGTDVVKALCLGARAVGVGKLLGWGLAAGGEAGLVRMHELLDLEIRTAMGLMGVTTLAQLGPSWVRPAQPVRPATQTNAYPWFEEKLRK